MTDLAQSYTGPRVAGGDRGKGASLEERKHLSLGLRGTYELQWPKLPTTTTP